MTRTKYNSLTCNVSIWYNNNVNIVIGFKHLCDIRIIVVSSIVWEFLRESSNFCNVLRDIIDIWHVWKEYNLHPLLRRLHVTHIFQRKFSWWVTSYYFVVRERTRVVRAKNLLNETASLSVKRVEISHTWYYLYCSIVCFADFK